MKGSKSRVDKIVIENIKKTDAVNEYQAQFYEVNAAVTNLSLIHI